MLHLYDICDDQSQRPRSIMNQDTDFKIGGIFVVTRRHLGELLSCFVLQFSHVVQSGILAAMVGRHLTDDFFDQSDQLVNVWPLR